jgi:hypothetical protein
MPDDASAQEPRDQQFVRWLRALADAVERDPALAARLQQEAAEPALPALPTDAAAPAPTDAPAPTEVAALPDEPPAEAIAPTLRHTRRSSRYGPPSVTGRPAELGTGIPDPFVLYAAGGEESLRRALETLRIGSLRAIIRAHGIDPQGKLSAGATEKRLISAIIAAARRASAPTPRKGTQRAKQTRG